MHILLLLPLRGLQDGRWPCRTSAGETALLPVLTEDFYYSKNYMKWAWNSL